MENDETAKGSQQDFEEGMLCMNVSAKRTTTSIIVIHRILAGLRTCQHMYSPPNVKI